MYITHHHIHEKYGTINKQILNLSRRAITEFNLDRTVVNINVNENGAVSRNTIMNILNNLIPYETIVCDVKDPPWFNKKIKPLIQEKKRRI